MGLGCGQQPQTGWRRQPAVLRRHL